MCEKIDTLCKNRYTGGAGNSFKVLFVGNSYSDDTIQLAWQIATSAGLNNVVIADVYHGGCTIDQHIEFANTDGIVRSTSDGENYNCRAEDGIVADNWDWIVFQQGSRDSGIATAYDNLPKLIA